MTTLSMEQLKEELTKANQRIEQLEIQLKDNEQEKIKEILDLIPDMILIVDTDMKVRWANRSALEKRKDALGQHCYKAYRGLNSPCTDCPCAIALQTGEKVSGVIALQDPDSDTVTHWENFGIPLVDHRGEVTGILEISRDVTALVEYNQKIHEYTEALELTRKELESSNSVKTEFLGNLAQDLAVPVNSVVGMVQMLEGSSLDNRQQEYLDVLGQSTDKIKSITQNIEDMSRLETGKISLKHEPFHLNQIFEELSAIYGKKAKAKDIIFESTSAVDQQVYMGDGRRLRQALLNLLNHAMKQNENGRVKFSMKRIENGYDYGVISFTIEDGSQQRSSMPVHFDHGLVLENQLEKHYATAEIGIAITYQIIDLMNGDIIVQQDNTAGSTISVQLRFDKQMTKAVETTTDPQPAKRTSKLRILIAEDEIVGRVTYKLMLRDRYDIVFAKNGEEAVQLYFDVEPDLVLLDVMMPILNGFEAFDAIDSKAISRVPIIAVSSRVISTEKEYLTSYGFDDYLAKPFENKDLERIIHTHGKKR